MTKIPDWAEWITRDEDGELWVHAEEPYITDYYWDSDRNQEELDSKLFPQVAWKEQKPTKVSDLIKTNEIEKPTIVDEDRNTFKWVEKPYLLPTKETLDKVFWFKSDEKPTEVKIGLEAGGVSMEELNRITSAKAHGYGEVPEVETEPNHERWSGENKGSLEEKLSELGNAYAPFLEKAGEKAEDAFRKYCSITELETNTNKDMVNKPNHYIGEYGLEVEDVLRNFIPRYTDPYVGHRIASAIEYLLRSPLKNGQQDIEKARKNLDQALVYIDEKEMK